MNADELEFALSQYHDGTLPEAQRAEVEERLRTDPEARATLAQFARLDSLVRDGAARLPELHWDRVAEHLCGVVEERTQPASYPIWMYRRPVWASAAIAAAVLVAVSLSIRLGVRNNPAPPQPSVEVAVDLPQPAPPTGSEVVDVSVAEPAPNSALAANYAVDDSVIVHRPVILLAGFTPGASQVH